MALDLAAGVPWRRDGEHVRCIGANGVGRVTIEFEVTNYRDLVKEGDGLLEPEKVRRLRISGVADSGAAGLVLPQAVVKQLGLPPTDEVEVRYADGRTAVRKAADAAYVEILGRHGVFTAIAEPKRRTALVGAIVLEDLDLLVDCRNQRLIPRDPRRRIYEIE
jgi:predicted aspartyl protease